MNLAGWRLLLFAVAGAGAIVLLASIGTPGGKTETVDRHTGERIYVVRTVADAVFAARREGNAQRALEHIAGSREKFPEEPVLLRYEAVLQAELSAPDAPPPSAHPGLSRIEAELRRAAQVREELKRRAGERLTREALFALLADLEADGAIAKATEGYFAPLARWRQERPEAFRFPDEMAVRTLALEQVDDPELYLKVARAFQSQNRPRARLRWLLRAHGAFPASAEARDMLMAAYLERGRTVEAFLVLGTALRDEPGNFELWEQRALMAGWLSLPDQEAEARERLLEQDDTPEQRERLITLYRFVGRPGDAVKHAAAIARTADDMDARERPAILALEAGDIGRALDMYDEQARRSDDPRYWREKIIGHARNDLRVERVLAELELLRKRYPDADYDRRLENWYHRLDRPERLATLLDERLARTQDEQLEDQLVHLHASLGHDERVRELLQARLARGSDPRHFFANLTTYQAAGLAGLGDRARAMAESDDLRPEDVPVVLGLLDPLLGEPDYLAAAVRIARRFSAHPDAREFLMARIDGTGTPDERVGAAEELARLHPDDDFYLQAWMDRAAWAGAVDAEIRARERWTERHTDDLDNRRALADLYAAVNRPADAAVMWRAIVEREGPGTDAVLRLIDALFAVDRVDEAMEWLAKRALLPQSSADDRLHVAAHLFSREHYDRALRFYMAVLDTQPDHPLALLRAGQIRAWTNDPRGAIPFYERRLEVTEEDAAEVRFFLGEAYWSIQDDDAGRRNHELALDALIKVDPRTLQQDVMVAKMLARFDRVDEAIPIFESVLAREPGSVDLILDYADSMLATDHVAKARALVDRAKEIDARRSRTMRLDGSTAIKERRFEDAADILAETLRLHGPDAGAESERGHANRVAGRYSAAVDAYERSLKLQPGNHDSAASLQALADRLADLVHANFTYRSSGSDSMFDAWAIGSLRLDNERTRIAGALGISSFSGRADAVDNGATDVDETALNLQLSLLHHFPRTNTVAGGLWYYPGVPGDTPLGAWIGVELKQLAPRFRSLEVKGYANLLFADPAAAAGLGGRRSGLLVAGQQDLLHRTWGAFRVTYDRLSIDDPAGGTVRDGRVEAIASLGWRVRDGRNGLADLMQIDGPTFPGLIGTHLEPDPDETTGPALNLWVSYHAIRLLDGADLAALIPLGERFDYLSVGGSADFHLAPGFGARVLAAAGTELQESSFFFSAEGGLTWRPSHATELTFTAGAGTAQGRTDDTTSLLVRLGFTHRW